VIAFDIQRGNARGIGPHSRENGSGAPNDAFVRESYSGIKRARRPPLFSIFC
jgi:hypothetical protein